MTTDGCPDGILSWNMIWHMKDYAFLCYKTSMYYLGLHSNFWSKLGISRLNALNMHNSAQVHNDCFLRRVKFIF